MALWDSASRRQGSGSAIPGWRGFFSPLTRACAAARRCSNIPATRPASSVSKSRAQSGRCSCATGRSVRPGDRVARLHFWNEHVPVVPPGGATIAWAGRMRNAIAAALHELADYLAARSDLADVVAICADVPSGTRAQSAQLARIMARYGFEAVAEPERLTLGERLHRFGENILISLIVLAQNAAALRADTLRRARLPIYLSRPGLERRFGTAAPAPETGESRSVIGRRFSEVISLGRRWATSVSRSHFGCVFMLVEALRSWLSRANRRTTPPRGPP